MHSLENTLRDLLQVVIGCRSNYDVLQKLISRVDALESSVSSRNDHVDRRLQGHDENVQRLGDRNASLSSKNRDLERKLEEFERRLVDLENYHSGLANEVSEIQMRIAESEDERERERELTHDWVPEDVEDPEENEEENGEENEEEEGMGEPSSVPAAVRPSETSPDGPPDRQSYLLLHLSDPLEKNAPPFVVQGAYYLSGDYRVVGPMTMDGVFFKGDVFCPQYGQAVPYDYHYRDHGGFYEVPTSTYNEGANVLLRRLRGYDPLALSLSSDKTFRNLRSPHAANCEARFVLTGEFRVPEIGEYYVAGTSGEGFGRAVFRPASLLFRLRGRWNLDPKSLARKDLEVYRSGANDFVQTEPRLICVEVPNKYLVP